MALSRACQYGAMSFGPSSLGKLGGEHNWGFPSPSRQNTLKKKSFKQGADVVSVLKGDGSALRASEERRRGEDGNNLKRTQLKRSPEHKPAWGGKHAQENLAANFRVADRTLNSR